MNNLSTILIFLLLQCAENSLALFLRVETGHQNIAIDGRDTYYGHYTKIHFHNVTCIDAIDIHCLKELTGAEEIDLLYSECQKGHWKVAHYTNSKHHFRLKEPIHALRLLISSRRELSVIDAQVESCRYPPAPPSDCHRPARNHNHRHGKPGQILRAVDPLATIDQEEQKFVSKISKNRRFKRSLPEETESESKSATSSVVITAGNHEFTEDKVVERNEVLRIEPGATLKFHNGTGLVVKGFLIAKGIPERRVIFEAFPGEQWRGIEFISAPPGSVMQHFQVKDAKTAVLVNKGCSPDFDHGVANSNGQGFKFDCDDTETTTRMTSVTASNNEKTGVEYLGKGSISIDRLVTAANGGLGLFVATPQRVTIRRSSASSNNGTGMYIGSSDISMEDVVVNGNGWHGIHAEVQNRLEMSGVNVSSHQLATAVELFLSAETEIVKIGIANSRLHDNRKGAVRVSGDFKSPRIILRGCSFSRNVGETVLMETFGNASFSMEKCVLTGNKYADFDAGDSIISLKNVDGNDNQISIVNTKFDNNIAHDIIRILKNSNDSDPSKSSRIHLKANEFNWNLAESAVLTNFRNISITENIFKDKKSDCEITYLPPASNENLNDVGLRESNVFEHYIQSVICVGGNNRKYKEIQMDRPETSTSRTTRSAVTHSNPFQVEGIEKVIQSFQEPYVINEEVLINKGETVIVQPGTILDFATSTGITVAGRLVLNGTDEQPIVLRGQNGNSWRGIVAKPQGVLDVIGTVIEDPSIGIWIDSQKVRIDRTRIQRPAVHGVEITQNSNDVVDLGGIIIEEATESAIGVDERRDDILIKNANIRDGPGTGIDFMTPTGNIELQNINISNQGGYGIHISEFPSSPLHAVLLEDISITDQKRGHAGILISGGWIQNVGLHNMKFADNAVPSLIVALECNDENEKLIRIENSTFERNLDIVEHVQLDGCVNLQMEKNRYLENNLDGIGSTLVITSDSNSKKKNGVMELAKNNFTNNGGIYTVTMDSNLHDVYFTDNSLTRNENSGAVLKISGENTKIVTNNFDNKDSKYQIAYSDDLPIDASFNDWNGLSEAQVLESIDAKQGSVLLHTPSVSASPQLDSLTTVVPVTIPNSVNAQCAHLKFCSNRGTCRDGICICPPGFVGFDCATPLFCNCSGNGLCNLLNICLCNDGWSGMDCSIPKCSENCVHGKCTAPNSCECEPGWVGQSCATSTCLDEQCVHGHCSGATCQCESGWKGSRCQVPICSDCSLNGVCTKPGVCSCFDDFGGQNCSKCIGDSCEPCDFDCNHGVCEPITKTCSCSGGWTGGACDVCSVGKCLTDSRINYIQPSTAELEDLNSVVNVFGEGFSITENGSYICTFGRTSVTGHRVSSTLLRCPIPTNLTLGRHVFSISKPGAFEAIGSAEAKPIHFTLYDGCDSSLCQGSCVGPLCICPQGKTGIFCDVIEILPTIDQRFLEHQRANQAFEGVPYVLMLPTLSSSVLRVNSTIPNLNFIASKGIVAWPEPIGSEEPYEISVTAFSPAGETRIGWNVTVAPQYGVELQNVTVDNGKAMIRGKLVGTITSGERPVIIRIRRDNVVDEIRAESNPDGSISFDYIPMLPGLYDVIIAHPNTNTDSITPTEFRVPEINLPILGESSNSSLTLNIPGRSNCEVKLIQPNVEHPEIQVHETQYQVNFGRFWSGEVLATVRCGDEPMEIVRAPPIDYGVWPTSPEVLTLYGSENIYEAKIHSPSHPFFTPDVDISDGSLHYLSTISENDHLRMTFAKSAGAVLGNGTIQINDGSKPLSTISYYYAGPDKSKHYNFKICVRDEFDGQEGSLASSEVATIAIQNSQKGVELTRVNIRLNVQWADFYLQPGTYSLMVRSELHDPVDEIIELTPLNSSFCVPLISSKSKNLPTIHCAHFTEPASCDLDVTSIRSSTDTLPSLSFEPSLVSSNGQKVLVKVVGSLDGVIGLWNGEQEGITVTPSRRSVAVNESFWINFGWEQDENQGGCGVKAIKVPFVFLPSSGVPQIPIHSSSTILIKTQPDNMELCGPSPATSTLVMCNCADGARNRCRAKYHSAVACGGSWNKIPDDTVSLEVLAAFLSMVFECREVSVSFEELQGSLDCVASIESDCPINVRRKRALEETEDKEAETSTYQDGYLDAPPDNDTVTEYQNDNPFTSFFNSMTSGFSRIRPVASNPDSNAIRVSSIFMEFIQRLQKMFPEPILAQLDRNSIDIFLKSISDSSEDGLYITESERRLIGSSGFDLIQLWNLTVKSWRSGKAPTERLGISHSDAKLLVAASDKLKSISRQNVAPDPFSMLHSHMEKMLETGESEQRECAKSTVQVDKTEVEEDGQLRVNVYIENRANTSLTNIRVYMEFTKSTNETPIVDFMPGPSWSAGIGSLTGLGVSQGRGSSFEIHWTRILSVPKRLTKVAKYQPIIIFSFSAMGRMTQQKLFAPELSVIPKKTIRAINIIKDSISPAQGVDFSIISSIINPGYSALKDVKILMDDLKFANSSTSTHLEAVFINGKPSHKSLSPHFSDIPSGSTKLIRVVFKDTQKQEVVPISSMNLTCIENGRLLPLDTTETYAIRASGISDFGMLLATPGQSAPLFYFRPAAAQMVNVIKLEFLSSQRINSTGRSQTTYVAAFRNPESASFGGALWARMPVPKVGNDHKLTGIVDRGGLRPRELQAVQWITEENGIEYLNWIDPGSSTTQQMIYEIQFSNPDDVDSNLDPSFDQLQYRIEIPNQNLLPDSEIGLIEADGDDLTYFLYSPDNQKRFSVDAETGRIFYDSEEPLTSDREYCVVLEARDPEGRISRVPVAINNGAPRSDCVLFSTNNLTPMIHFGDFIPMPSTFRPRTIAPVTIIDPTLSTWTPTTSGSSSQSSESSTPSWTTSSGSSGGSTETSMTPSETSTSSTSLEPSSQPTLSSTVSWMTSPDSSPSTLSSGTSSQPSDSSTSDISQTTSGSYSGSSESTMFPWTTSEGYSTSSNGLESSTSFEPTPTEPWEPTETTITFIDSTLETITSTPSMMTSSQSSSTSDNEVTTPSLTTLDSEGTSPEIVTSSEAPWHSTSGASFGTLPTDYPTPGDVSESTWQPGEMTPSFGTLPTDYPTPGGITTSESTFQPTSGEVTSSGTSATSSAVTLPTDYPTPSGEHTLLPITSSPFPTPDGTVITDPDVTLQPVTSSSSPAPLPTDYPTPGEMTSSGSTWNPMISTPEVTKILPTDPTTPTTTEFIYTVSSDGTLEPITATSPTVTDATWQTPIYASTQGGSAESSTGGYPSGEPTIPSGTTVPTTITTAAPYTDIECFGTTAALSPFSVMLCQMQGILPIKHRSQ